MIMKKQFLFQSGCNLVKSCTFDAVYVSALTLKLRGGTGNNKQIFSTLHINLLIKGFNSIW